MEKKRNAAFNKLKESLEEFNKDVSIHGTEFVEVKEINGGFVLKSKITKYANEENYAIKVLYTQTLAENEEKMIGLINNNEEIKKYIVPYSIYTKGRIR